MQLRRRERGSNFRKAPIVGRIKQLCSEKPRRLIEIN
jgi:hypothetical protein